MCHTAASIGNIFNLTLANEKRIIKLESKKETIINLFIFGILFTNLLPFTIHERNFGKQRAVLYTALSNQKTCL
jgi:hypothetical protein